MDRFRHKSKKDKPKKYVDKDKLLTTNSVADSKSIKENMKIKEILRNVKINSSMRIKAPRGSKLMHNKDFKLNDEVLDNGNSSQDLTMAAPNDNGEVISHQAEDINLDVNEVSSSDNKDIECESNGSQLKDDESNTNAENNSTEFDLSNEIGEIHENDEDTDQVPNEVLNKVMKDSLQMPTATRRDRKLSLDHTMLSRVEGSSQSELDLYLIGKSPLERKSSFFRKKMDSFMKNTTEIFKRRSFTGNTDGVQRRGSMSVSLQSLNKTTVLNHQDQVLETRQALTNQSVASLNLSSTLGRSHSSLSTSVADRTYTEEQPIDYLVASQPLLATSQQFDEVSSESVNSLNESHLQDAMLNSRAISMSSGLDSAKSPRRRKNSRSNRVSWLASEGLTNYFRRLIQDEKGTDSQLYYSNQDFSSISENGPVIETKGRRLSYQRAVSGEDPVRCREQRKRKPIAEKSEDLSDLETCLARFTRYGVPALSGYSSNCISEHAFNCLFLVKIPGYLEDVYDWSILPIMEQSRQAVIKELVLTEADYTVHLIAIVEVFLAAAHSLQDSGQLLDVDTEKLFINFPDILNASLQFWEATMVPVIDDALENNSIFNTDQMYYGFSRFRDFFAPYEKFVTEQTMAVDYLRSLGTHNDFMLFLDWCHEHHTCKSYRLKLQDFMVKPMQRLTKYSIILNRIVGHTDYEPERTTLIAMINFVKNHVLDLNRTIKQRDELEKLDMLANSIDPYEMDFKDEELDKYFKMYSSINLKAPMVNCAPHHMRYLIYEGDLRYRETGKEIEVRVFLLTDMLLICKKQSKGLPYRLIRPKYMLDRMIALPKCKPNSKEPIAICIVMVDDVTSACHGFCLTDIPNKDSKDSHPSVNLKHWESKLKEAKLCYDLCVFFTNHPSADISDLDHESSTEYGVSGGSRTNLRMTDDQYIEREARERMAVMLHRAGGQCSIEHDSQATMVTDSFEEDLSTGIKLPLTPNLPGTRFMMHRNSTGGESSRNSRLSSFQKSVSASHEEPVPNDTYRAGSSVEHVIPPQNPQDAATSITVNVVSESDSETVVRGGQVSPTPGPSSKSSGPLSTRPPMPSLSRPSWPSPRPPRSFFVRSHGPYVGKPCPPVKSPGLTSGRTSQNTLQVETPANAISLPDLTVDTSLPRAPPPMLHRIQALPPQSVSEKLYQSHQELLERNRLHAQQSHQYLSPHNRGTSYPPPSPTRASLRRGLAFSYSIKNPPLKKMGHVNSQSQQLAAEAGPSASQPTKAQPVKAQLSSPTIEKGDVKKKGKLVSSRHKAQDKGQVTRGDSENKTEDKPNTADRSKEIAVADKESSLDIDKETESSKSTTSTEEGNSNKTVKS